MRRSKRVRTAPGRTPQARDVAQVRARIREHLGVHKALAAQADVIVAIADTILTALRAGGQVLTFGNGGSASDAEHLASELVGRCVIDRGPLPSVALTTNTSTLTAVANDYGFAEVFARHLTALGRPGDVAIGITTSGRSENVLRALEAARKGGMVTVALTGRRGLVSGAVDVELRVPADVTPIVQEAHITAIHAICEIVERAWLAESRERGVRSAGAASAPTPASAAKRSMNPGRDRL